MSVSEQKAALRAEARARVRALTPPERADAATDIAARLVQAAAWQTAERLLFYAPLPDELDLSALLKFALKSGKTVALPRLVEATNRYEAAIIRHPSQDCVVGRFQVPEPNADCPVLLLNQLDFVLVPGVAFDAAGHRLGRGKGYYDRMLAGVRGMKCGVAYDCQLTAAIPEEPHDVKLNCLVTPTRWLEFSPASRS